ncbi:MAG: tRNA 2-thiocytidine biosynthesis protein TtcA [Clostridia bacterium]|nr:tRNA 2-thiocytidine biosynthesis protein TtcA [Clostridia bacterium]
MKKELTPTEKIEQSINKKYRKTIWNPFIESVKRYKLIEENDRIAVCISGGKDSLLLALLMKMLQRYSEFPFHLEYIVMDPGYLPENREKILNNASLLGIDVKIFNTDIFNSVENIKNSPCYVCARMRRGYLYEFAQSIGCTKIALGHHLDDVIETTVMAMFYGAQLQGMLPKLRSTNHQGMQLIRPLYTVEEDAIISWRDYNGLTFLQCACRFTEKAADDEKLSKRHETKMIIKALKNNNPLIKMNIFNALHNVCLDTFCEYKANGIKHGFNEIFDENKINNTELEK